MSDVTRGGSSHMLKYRLGVDLGKTKIAAGIIDVAQQKIVDRLVVQTDTSNEGAYLSEQVCDVISKLMNSSKLDIQLIGVASFGMVDSTKGIILGGKWMSSFHNVPLGPLLQEKFGIPARIENDVSAAALGEYRCGHGNGQKSISLLSLGTSVGLASVIHGQLILGTAGRAGQIAHLPFGKLDAPTLSDLIGGSGLAQRASLLTGIELSSKAVFELESRGDSRLSPLIDDWVELVGQVIVWIVCFIDPPLIVITGGLFDAKRDLLPEVHASALRSLRNAWPCLAQSGINLAKSKLGVDGALLGVVLLPEVDLL